MKYYISDYLEMTFNSHFSPGTSKMYGRKNTQLITKSRMSGKAICKKKRQRLKFLPSFCFHAQMRDASKAISAILVLKSTLSLENVNYN